MLTEIVVGLDDGHISVEVIGSETLFGKVPANAWDW